MDGGLYYKVPAWQFMQCRPQDKLKNLTFCECKILRLDLSGTSSLFVTLTQHCNIAHASEGLGIIKRVWCSCAILTAKFNCLYFISSKELPAAVKVCIYLNVGRHVHFVIITALTPVWEWNGGYRTWCMTWEISVLLLPLPCKLVHTASELVFSANLSHHNPKEI